jgi:hypothetical protein
MAWPVANFIIFIVLYYFFNKPLPVLGRRRSEKISSGPRSCERRERATRHIDQKLQACPAS